MKIYEEQFLTIGGLRFWDLLIQKLLRIAASLKFISFILIYHASIKALYADKISGVVFGSIITGGLVVLIGSRVFTDTRLFFKNGKDDG